MTEQQLIQENQQLRAFTLILAHSLANIQVAYDQAYNTKGLYHILQAITNSKIVTEKSIVCLKH